MSHNAPKYLPQRRTREDVVTLKTRIVSEYVGPKCICGESRPFASKSHTYACESDISKSKLYLRMRHARVRLSEVGEVPVHMRAPTIGKNHSHAASTHRSKPFYSLTEVRPQRVRWNAKDVRAYPTKLLVMNMRSTHSVCPIWCGCTMNMPTKIIHTPQKIVQISHSCDDEAIT